MAYAPLSRRTAAAAALLPAAAALMESAAQGQPRGPAVWLDMDQAALDAAYDQSVYAPNFRQVLDRYAANSRLTRQALGNPLRYPYGAMEIEALDIYRTGRSGRSPVLIFLHGGAWRAGLARDYAFPAECFVRAGAHFVVPDFSWVQDRGGDLMAVADQIRRSIAWVARNANTFGGDPERLFIAGHSSGAHMSAVALTTDWAGAFGLPADLLKGGLLVSGPYDLMPVRLSARSSYVRLTDESEAALSPQRHIAALRAPVVVVHGALETPEYQRHARDFAAAVAAAGKPVQSIRGEHYNHFEIAETMANPYGLAGRAGLQLLGL